MKDNSATKLCKHCKSEMKKGAKVCPTCGKKQGMSLGCLIPLILLGIIIAIIIAVVGSCSKAVDDAIKDDEKKSESKKVAAETVIYDKDGIKITYMGMEAATLNVGTDIKLMFENNSDNDVSITVDDFSVDGYTINAPAFVEVGAGKKANDSIEMLDSYLEKNGLSYDTVKEAELKFDIQKKGTLESVKTDTIKIKLR